MEREKFMQEARLTANKILVGKENGIMNLVQQAWAEGERAATTSYQEGASDVKRAVDKILEREKFMQEARLTANKILVGKENGIMNLVQQAWAEGERAATTSYQEGASDVKRAVDKILDVMSYDANALFHVHNETMAANMLHVLYGDGNTNRWPLGTKFEPLWTDSGLFDDLVCGIRDADEADREERKE